MERYRDDPLPPGSGRAGDTEAPYRHTVALSPIRLFYAFYVTVLLPPSAAGVHVRISLALPAAIGRHSVLENSAGGGGSAGGWLEDTLPHASVRAVRLCENDHWSTCSEMSL